MFLALPCAVSGTIDFPKLEGHAQYETFAYPNPQRVSTQSESFFELLLRAHGTLAESLHYSLETSLVADDAGFTAGGYSWRNEEIRRPYLALRVATIDYRPTSTVRVRAGKQIVNWSVFDELQPANLMDPKDSSDAFRRTDIGLYGVSLRTEQDPVYAELAVAPFVFMMPRLPQGRWNILPGNVRQRQEVPAVAFDESQAGLRLGALFDKLDVALLGYVGRDYAAVFEPRLIFVGGAQRFRLEIFNRYPQLRAGGFNASYPIGDSILVRSELVYFSSPEDIRDNFFLTALGAEYTWRDWRINLNYLRNDMVDRASVEVTDKGERFFFESFLSTELRYDPGGRWEGHLRGGYDATARFYVIQPEVSVALWDNVRLALNADLINGKRFGYFERIRYEDRIGVLMRYHF